MAGTMRPLTQESAELVARRFQALADPTRLRILDVLRDRDEASVSELTELLGTSQQNVSKHLAALRDEGFLTRRKEKTSSLYRIADATVLELCEQMCSAMEAQWGELGAALRAS
jgi:DNA-binding transcriptional ArsR family regulator